MTLEPDMFPISIDTFFGGRVAHVDLYLLIREKKYIKIVKKGDDYDIKRLRNYENKEVQFVYINTSDIGVHVKNCVQIARTLVRGPVIPTRNKAFVACRAAEAVLDEIYALGLTDEAYNHVQEVCSAIKDLSQELTSLSDIYSELTNVSRKQYRHSIFTSFLSTIMGHALQWTSIRSLNILAIGGLVHDIGFVKLSPEIAEIETSDFTPEQLEEYKSHPEIGYNLIQHAQPQAREIALIVRDHHESPDGNGFPRGLTNGDIYPMARTVNFADQITHLILDKKSPLADRNIREAVKYLKYKERQLFPELYWENLEKWFSKLDS
ncbi:MAG: HD domain-containing protein [Bdellovibrionales bacterium]|nr:HD domain-containing protein [Bdellovibrionales bacterium]